MSYGIFNGYHTPSFYIESPFVVGKKYHIVDGTLKLSSSVDNPNNSDAKFIDERGRGVWEEIKFFSIFE